MPERFARKLSRRGASSSRHLGTPLRALSRRLGFTSLLLLLVAAGSATAGIVAGRDTGTASGPRTIVATSPVVTAPPAPPVPRRPPPPSTASAPTPKPTAEAREPSGLDRLARAGRLHGRPRLDPGARHRPAEATREGEAGALRAASATSACSTSGEVREPPPRLLRRLRRRLRLARGGADGRDAGHSAGTRTRTRARSPAKRGVSGRGRARRSGMPTCPLAPMATKAATL